MVHETEPLLFSAWIAMTVWVFLERLLLLGLGGLLLGYLVSAFRYGPLVGGDVTFRVVKTGFLELFQLSPRRIGALAWLAIQESIRRRILVAFGIFLVILLFAGWFLDTTSNDPSTLYLSFVLTTTTYLVLLMALFLSAFSLPADIKNQTIYTIVTKPVRSGEIVLGRIFGFSAIGTVLVATMGLFSYFFVVRLLNHTHDVEVSSLSPVKGDLSGTKTGRTTLAQNHRHEVTLDADGTGTTDIKQHHWHDITPGVDKDRYVLGPPEGMLQARVPVYGKLRFKERAGRDGKGSNVGNEWTYRSYIEGGTLAAAIWTFEDIRRDAFPDGLPLEMTIRVFRTYKGDINKGILGSIIVKNPTTGRSSEIDTFRAKDNEIDERLVPVKLKDSSGNDLDLFDDLVTDDGKLEVWLQCLDPAQYFGAAQADLYLRARDASFVLNFVKGYTAIWLQMVLVTSFGVMFSTFLNGAVAMLATLGTVLLGYCTEFITRLAHGQIKGGGPLESLIRIPTHQNMVTELEPGLTRDVVQTIDGIFMAFMEAATHLIPDFNQFINVDYVAHGYDIPVDTVLIQVFSSLGYLGVVFVVGYVFLKTREVAR